MINILYYKLNKVWEEQIFSYNLSLLPKILQQKILLYKNKNEQQLRICGKLMLLQLLNESDKIKDCGLNDIQYDEYNKPFFKENFHFSISHSEDFVLCAAAKQNRMGIDVEKIKLIDVRLLKNIFSLDEWLSIEQENYNLNYFYYLWTRKEAVLKAIGKGVVEEMEKIEVLKDIIFYESQQYIIYDLPIDDAYIVAMACNNNAVFNVNEFIANTMI